MLGEDEDWLWKISDDMDPDDGCLWVYGIGDDVRAFTPFGIEVLMQIISDERAAGRAPPPAKPTPPSAPATISRRGGWPGCPHGRLPAQGPFAPFPGPA